MSTPLPSAYAFGDNEHTRALAEFYPLLGIVDEYSNANTVAGVPKVNLADVDKNQPIINCVYNSRAYFAQNRLEELGFEEVIFVGEIIAQYPDLFAGTMLADAYIGMQKDFLVLKNWQALFEDEQSQHEFSEVLDFRRTLNVYHLTDLSVKIDEQYYESFLSSKDYQCLIDGGAYDGHDCLRFSEYFPNYKQIVALEPCADNRGLMAEKLKGLCHVEIMAACLGNRQRVVYFDGLGTAAKIVDQGGVPVDMVALDDLITEHKTLIKLDIEGAEISALAGAKKALNNPKVGFAISAYHLPHDLFDIFQVLKGASVNRRFYFRHYSNGIAESVIFAI